ncbi:MAG: hypothetical protein PUF62_03095 [Bacteroidales bacterium]|nr:hypothetical protein [Bacteroidales bacterium]
MLLQEAGTMVLRGGRRTERMHSYSPVTTCRYGWGNFQYNQQRPLHMNRQRLFHFQGMKGIQTGNDKQGRFAMRVCAMKRM